MMVKNSNKKKAETLNERKRNDTVWYDTSWFDVVVVVVFIIIITIIIITIIIIDSLILHYNSNFFSFFFVITNINWRNSGKLVIINLKINDSV